MLTVCPLRNERSPCSQRLIVDAGEIEPFEERVFAVRKQFIFSIHGGTSTAEENSDAILFTGIFDTLPIWLLILTGVLAIWEAVWKIVAIWKSARNNHLAWFICIIVFNTIGILPIIYILMHRNEEK